MNGTQSQPPGGGDPIAALRREVYEESLGTDSLAEHLEYRVAALEEITAARWPRRWLLRARLGRKLRGSVRNLPGQTWAERRSEAAGLDWIGNQPRQGCGR